MRHNQQIKAFSLIELSIVIVIVSILVTAGLAISASRINSQKIEITNKRLNAIYKALGAYLLVNNKLPCPAPINISRNSSGYGTSNSGASCTTSSGVFLSSTAGATSLAYGAVPTKTLELPSEFAEDGFGSKIAYIVHVGFTSTISATTGGHSTTYPYTPSSTIIQIKENPAATITEQYAIFALVSYGANKSGAFNANSTTQNAASSDSNEIDNSPGAISGTSANFDNILISLASNSATFDDIVFAKNRTQIINDANALSAIPCDGLSGFISSSASYGQIIFNSNSCSYQSFEREAKKCNAFGVWSDFSSC